ncbi:hypothetical protein E1091_19265 [Micromonospora fluostatini]|uniref:Uncharacterized protein n=1 Tax=Micromonospora fluostatini TaxID=1629071 RepID=A0ABY2DBX7_9ACTN|nr:hypothetical protein E1091_19265 [Micromonospora fluostatini]
MHRRFGPMAVATTLITLGALLIATFTVAAFLIHTVTPKLLVPAVVGLALIQVGVWTAGRVSGVQRTIDTLAAALREPGH